jgi:deoxyribonuclease V
MRRYVLPDPVDQISEGATIGPDEAIDLQLSLRERVRIEPLRATVRHIAGCDIAYEKSSTRAHAAIVILNLPTLDVAGWGAAAGEEDFAYIPGLLSFREIPLLLKAWESLNGEPDAVMVDGQGLAHPRRFGLACHLGVLIDKPCLGCAKSWFVGTFKEPKPEPGSYEYLVDGKDIVGAAVRTRERSAPVFISPGHKIDVAGSVELTLDSVRRREVSKNGDRLGVGDGVRSPARYRIPEPTRLANLLADALRRGESGEDALRTATR